MSDSIDKNCVIFLDLSRSLALLLIVFSVTFNSTISSSFNNEWEVLPYLWYYINSVIPAFFLLTFGSVFMYLYNTNGKPFKQNERAKKSFKRALLLIFIGYFLQLPSLLLIIGKKAFSELNWSLFWNVDILQVTGVSILLALGLLYLSEKLKIQNYLMFAFCALVILGISFIFEYTTITDNLPFAINSYFQHHSGSLYPLFPFGFYFLLGSCIGCFLSQTKQSFINIGATKSILISGILLILFSYLINYIFTINHFNEVISKEVFVSVFRRSGLVMLIFSIVIYISIFLQQIPKILILLGRNTLLVLIVHLLIIKRAPFHGYFFNVYSPEEAILISLGMIALMTLLVLLFNKFKFKNISLVNN